MICANVDEQRAYALGWTYAASHVAWCESDLSNHAMQALRSRREIKSAIDARDVARQHSTTPRLEHCWRIGLIDGIHFRLTDGAHG